MRLHLEIFTPDAIILQDNVDSVQVPAIDGECTLLPNHAPIFLSLHAGSIVIQQSTETEHWFIDRGTCHMEDNKCTIMVQNVLDLEKIDAGCIVDALCCIVDPNFSDVKRQLLEAQLAYKRIKKNT